MRVRFAGPVDYAHSATPDFACNHIGADSLADARNGVPPNPCRRIFGAGFEIVAGASPENFCLGQERFSFLEQRLIVGTRAFYKRQTGAGGFLLERVVQDRFQPLPSLRIHIINPRVIIPDGATLSREPIPAGRSQLKFPWRS